MPRQGTPLRHGQHLQTGGKSSSPPHAGDSSILPPALFSHHHQLHWFPPHPQSWNGKGVSNQSGCGEEPVPGASFMDA